MGAVDFGPALTTALGGAIALAGGVVVNRSELRRRLRLQLYQELLPPIRDGVLRVIRAVEENPNCGPSDLFEIQEGAYRAARQAAITDRRTSHLAAQLCDVTAQVTRGQDRFDSNSTWHPVEYVDLITTILTPLTELETHLRKKIH